MTFDPLITTALFYLIFLSQIYLLSLHYPRIMLRRLTYVLKNFPANDYPKLYPASYTFDTERKARQGMRLFRGMNIVIALIGLGLILTGLMTGYRPQGHGEEALVAAFFVLQAVPHVLTELTTFKHYKLMRQCNNSSRRTASLTRRHLFDFISPVPVILAVALIIIWLVYFLTDAGLTVPLKKSVYVMLLAVSMANFVFVAMIVQHLRGRKLDPHLAHKDKLKQTELVIRSAVIGSIALSSFLIIDQTVQQYALDYLQPAIISLYFQAIIIFGPGAMLRGYRPEEIDFSVYKKDARSL
ncbi:hypothetical protein [Paremcibacter congregatus]|uniref:hypothetical protein n=1 Tax=Paremcibacter congregatus TaxID=2043170 RepID=UPI003A94BEE4